MGTKILHVYYLHECDWCGKKKRSKLPIPENWLKVSLHRMARVFCKEACKEAFEHDQMVQEFVKLKESVHGATLDIPTAPSGRKAPRRYKQPS